MRVFVKGELMKKVKLTTILTRCAMCLAFVMAFALTGCIGVDEHKKINLMVEGDYVQWQEEGSEDWQNLIALEEVRDLADGITVEGETNPKINEKEIEFRKTNTYFQWRYVSKNQHEDKNWNNLILLSELGYLITYNYEYSGFDKIFENYQESQIVFFNDEINVLPTPKHDCGGEFDGWYIKGTDTKVTSSDVISENIVFESRWSYLPSGAYSGDVYEYTWQNLIYDGKIYVNGVNSITGHSLYSGAQLLLVVDKSISSIDDYAFNGCSKIANVTLPNSVIRIGDYAFKDCDGLTSITIPNSVTNIGDGVLRYCDSLTKIKVDENNIKYDSRNNCNAIIETATNTLMMGCNSTVIPDSIISIGDYAFVECDGLTSITIPNSVTRIGYYAFNRCDGLTSITISNSVTHIENYAFAYCYNLTRITIPGDIVSVGDYDYAFMGCRGLTSVTISGDDVTSVFSQAFRGCKGLTSITILESVTSIGDHAFYHCTGLTNVTIPSSVISIGEWAFSDCTGLTNVTIPSSVISIGGWAFSDCTGLKSITIPANVSMENSSIFAGSTQLRSIIFLSGDVTSSGVFAFKHGSGLRITNITMLEGVTSIGDYAFSNWKELESLTILNCETSIGNWAFTGCTALTSITMPGNLTSIGDYAFNECIGLNNIIMFGSNITNQIYPVFYNCEELDITILEGVTSIGEYAFYYCDNLTSITIPSSVTSIGEDAFQYCDGLTKIIFKGTQEQWNAINIGSNNSVLTDGSVTIRFEPEE